MGLPGSFTDPATGFAYRTYTNPPSREEAASSTAYYGVLCRRIADGKLYYLVVVRRLNEPIAVAWSSKPDAGSGEIRRTVDGRLCVTWRTGQSEGAPIEYAEVPGYVPPAGPPVENVRELIVQAFRALLSPEAWSDWARRLGWG